MASSDESGTTVPETSETTGPASSESGSTEDTSTVAETSSTADTSTGTTVAGEIRAVHAAAGVGPVDIYLAGEANPLFEGLAYADATAWVEVPVGSWRFDFRPAGAAADSPPLHTSVSVSVGESDRVTAIASGLIDADEPASAFRVLPVLEDWGAPLAGRARARLVHAGADAPTFGVDGVEVDAPLQRFTSSAADGFALDGSGGDRLLLLEDVPVDPETITSFTTPPVSEGDEVLLIAAGNLSSLAREPDGFSVIAVGRDGALGHIQQDPQLFVLHGSRDAGSLETCADDTELAANFEYGEIQSTRVSPGTYDVSIHNYPSGCGAPVFNTNSTGALEAGERYLLLVTGEIDPEDSGEASIQVATFDDAYTLGDRASARVRFVHGASYSQIYVGSVVDDQIVDANVYTAPIEWSVESAQVQIMAGVYLLGIADAVGKPEPPYAPIVTVPFQAVGGARQWVIVAGDPSPEPSDGGLPGGFLQAIVVDTTTPQWGVTIVDVDIPET
ncbi:MAG: DUF4397 domain-containing protein [Deltaproteobacteria bacterium]|nr:DUF4397 domain-containing protein [Nannocystaceae bacterium]